jgi:O-acetylhomoserine/O-acetylserine sulfhydrylase-like pyridoxal-dependent enzyme
MLDETTPCISTRRQLRVETLLLHGGFRCDPSTFATIVPICLSNAYVFESIEKCLGHFRSSPEWAYVFPPYESHH